jgi:leucyl-tRNA synthetase
MSKSRGNVISPDDYIKQYGSDVFRLYLMFGFSYSEGGPWSDEGIKAIARFVNRVERFIEKFIETRQNPGKTKEEMEDAEKELNYVRHYTIKHVTLDADKFEFNTAIARIMELVNALYKYENEVEVKNMKFYEDVVRDFVKILAPFAPHFSEEMWERLGYEYSVFNQKWPEWDEKALERDMIEIAIQVNGKVRSKAQVPSNATDEELKQIALSDERVKSYLDGKEIKKVIIVKNRLVNIVVN